MKVSYADYENKTSEALADTMDCSVHKKPVIYDDNDDGHDDDDDEKDVDSDNDNGHEDDDDERTATIMFRIMKIILTILTMAAMLTR